MENTSETKQILNYNTIIIIILLFIFSSKIWNSIWELSKSLIYAVIILYLLNYMNPNIMQKIKKMFINYLTSESDVSNNYFKNTLSKLASNLLNIISPTKITPNDIINNVNNLLDNNILTPTPTPTSTSTSTPTFISTPTPTFISTSSPTFISTSSPTFISNQNRNLRTDTTQNRNLRADPTQNRNLTKTSISNRNLILKK